MRISYETALVTAYSQYGVLRVGISNFWSSHCICYTTIGKQFNVAHWYYWILLQEIQLWILFRD